MFSRPFLTSARRFERSYCLALVKQCCCIAERTSIPNVVGFTVAIVELSSQADFCVARPCPYGCAYGAGLS